MRMHHPPSHWILVALVLAALLLTLTEVHGQSAGAAAVFEGRPAMAGAQAGLGAQAGPSQGGIGVQGTEAAERNLRLRRPSGLADMPQGQPADDAVAAAKRQDTAVPKEPGIAREERSAVRKTKRAAKRTLRRARTGTSEIDSRSGDAR
ncbi:hypothetical protein [Ramlibacter sp.]|uniref:hypothetical protein n=1 Tax=Ramlibacter sp. TaxID=1917967 RepID=UPI002C1A1204|nr:hypothetical protein [Ramlibacter sp.]HWI83511.1 hypothetical protein [Ramlibacter sp.]